MSTVLLETEEEEPFVMLVRYVAQRLDDKESAVRLIATACANRKIAFKMPCYCLICSVNVAPRRIAPCTPC